MESVILIGIQNTVNHTVQYWHSIKYCHLDFGGSVGFEVIFHVARKSERCNDPPCLMGMGFKSLQCLANFYVNMESIIFSFNRIVSKF